MLESFGIDWIYVVHAKKGYEFHEERINKLFQSSGCKFEFVTDGDPSLFTPELIQKYFVSEIHTILGKGRLSLTLNHIFSYEKIVGNENRYALVFEDDPFFLGNFTEKIGKIMQEAKTLPPGFLVSLENSTLKFPRRKSIRKGKLLYKEERGRCAGGYILDLQGAKNLLSELRTHKCSQIIDWWHNDLVRRKIIDMYWAHPPIMEQGSHNGQLSSTVSTQRSSMTRKVSWQIQKFYKMYIRQLFT
jgi:glycosyl transferase family 25